jgi:membrane protease YdiL (CAAX protease family)
MLAVHMKLEPWELLRFVIYLAIPTFLLRLRPSKNPPFDVYHILAILFIWIPLELDLFALILDLVLPFANLKDWFSGLRLLPPVTATLVPGITLPVDLLTGVSLLLFLFSVHHPLNDIGFSFRLHMKDLKVVLLGLSAYVIVGLPLGIGLGFLRYDPAMPSVFEMFTFLLAGYFFVALVEETLFRGVIQNLLSKRVKKAYAGLAIAAVIFGLSHLNNATVGFSEPNYAYALMATLAGLCYGWVWIRTGKLSASAVTHALVNLIWWIIFQ